MSNEVMKLKQRYALLTVMALLTNAYVWPILLLSGSPQGILNNFGASVFSFVAWSSIALATISAYFKLSETIERLPLPRRLEKDLEAH